MRKRMTALLILLAFGATTTRAFASGKNHPTTMSSDDIKRRIVEAQFNDKRLIIHLKDGGASAVW